MIDRLRQNLVDSALHCFFHERLLCMPGNCRNNWLLQVIFEEILPYSLGGIVSIQVGHVAIHKDEQVRRLLPIVILLNVIDHFIDCVEAIASRVTENVGFQADFVLHYDLQSIDVKGLVVYYQNPLVLRNLLEMLFQGVLLISLRGYRCL